MIMCHLSIKEAVYCMDLAVIIDAEVDASLTGVRLRIMFRPGCKVSPTYRRKCSVYNVHIIYILTPPPFISMHIKQVDASTHMQVCENSQKKADTSMCKLMGIRYIPVGGKWDNASEWCCIPA